MDKSEGTDFISKTFSSLSEKISKLYHTGNMKLSLSTLKRSRSEKVRALGNKVVDLIAADKAITAATLKNEYNAIIELDRQIELAEKDLHKIKTSKTVEKKDKVLKKTKDVTPKAVKTTKTTKKTTTKKKNLPAVRPRKTSKVTQVTTPTPEVIAVENKDAE